MQEAHGMHQINIDKRLWKKCLMEHRIHFYLKAMAIGHFKDVSERWGTGDMKGYLQWCGLC